MNTMHPVVPLSDCASDLLDTARDFQAAARQSGSAEAVPAVLATLEQALQALSASWYPLSADAAPGVAETRRPASLPPPVPQFRDGLSREQEAHLVATLHDVGAAFANCARACKEGRSTVAPLIARRITAKARGGGAAGVAAGPVTCRGVRTPSRLRSRAARRYEPRAGRR